MGQARDEAGNIWETDAQGNPVSLVTPGPTSGGHIFSLAPNPKDVIEQQRKDATDAREAAKFKWEQEKHDKEVATEQPIGDGHLTGDAYLKTLPEDVASQVLALASGRMAFPTGKAAASPYWQQRVQAVAQYDPMFDTINYNARAAARKDFTSGKSSANIKALNTAIGHLGQLGDQISGTASHGGLPGATILNRMQNAVARSSGDSGITKYEQTAGALSGELTQVYRQSGGAEADIQRYLKELDSSQSAEQKKAAIANMAGLLKSRLDAINDQYVKGMGTSAQPLQVLDPHAVQVLTKYMPGFNPGPSGPDGGSGGNGPDAPTDSGGPQTSAASGDFRTEHSDRMDSMVNSMVNAGAGMASINAALAKASYPPLDAKTFNAAKKWMADTGKPYFAANITRNVPLNIGQKIAGSAPGAFLASMANSATAGIPGALAGPSSQGALDAMAALHPDAAVTGDVVGSIAGMGGAEAAVARNAPAALAKYAPRIADALYGGVQGFNGAQEGDGLSGALKGAVTTAAGGAIGSKLMSGVGAVAKGIRNPSVQYLRSLGIPLTIGQAASQSGRIGATVKGVEDAMTSLPGVGNMIDARRMEGLRGFNSAAFDAAGNPISGVVDAAGNPITNGITDIGSAGIRQLDAAKSQAYSSALDPVTIDAAHPAFINDVQGAIQSGAAIPNVNGAQDAALASLKARIGGAVDPATDTISGRGFQEAYRGLARTGRERSAGDYGHEIGQTMRQGQEALSGALETQHPGAFFDFLNANQANRNLNVLADAVGKAKNTGEVFMPSQLNMADAATTARLNGKIASAAGNRPFYDLTQAGQDVLPSKLPDSGTAKRAIVGGLLTGGLGGVGGLAGGQDGAATGSELGLGMTLALMLGGTKGAQAAATKLMLDRPDVAIKLGNAIQPRSNLGGLLGAAVSAPRSSPFSVGQ